ncbi:peptidase C19 family protein [Cavenderia fasciculata]|uniref:Ubiquitin carboxyl-terminal hydrolase n=1 Tax=Cavenderia fasciculata TaxID=261658 RepID=F4PPW7_CACFS|nr:peptidase C19 family protein [Cavenderia fasciculata]EGG22430.1 peptidase C19 family protein [Cavenderia fasciculata]|eukprot:XP_004360281.1 peptidase C19 family protein [Cavenderia fasciculata]
MGKVSKELILYFVELKRIRRKSWLNKKGGGQSTVAANHKKSNQQQQQNDQKKKETISITIDENGTTLKLKLVGSELICTNCIEQNTLPTKKGGNTNVDITKMQPKCAMCFTGSFDKKKEVEEKKQEAMAQHQSLVKSKTIGIGIKGLQNLGNTCFFNSVLQNLTHVNMLRDAFLEFPGEEKSTIKSTNQMTMEMHHFFLKMYKQPSSIVSPSGLLSEISKKSPRFRGGKQQDSHELLRYLLDGLISEEQSASTNKRDPTYIDRIFGGRLISIITCFHCGNVSKTYEPFLDLSLPLPMLAVAADKRPLPSIQNSPLPANPNRFTQLDIADDGDEGLGEDYYRTIYDNIDGSSSGGGKLSKSKMKRLQKQKNQAARNNSSTTAEEEEETPIPIDVEVEEAASNESKQANGGEQDALTTSPIISSPDGADGSTPIIIGDGGEVGEGVKVKEDYIKREEEQDDGFTPSPPVTPPTTTTTTEESLTSTPTTTTIETPNTFRESTDFILLGSPAGNNNIESHQEQVLSTFSVIENYENPSSTTTTKEILSPISPISISANTEKSDRDVQDDPIDLRKGIPSEAKSLDQLLACFLQFTNPEKLEGDNGFICSKCTCKEKKSEAETKEEKLEEEKKEEEKLEEKKLEEKKLEEPEIINEVVKELLSTSLNEKEFVTIETSTAASPVTSSSSASSSTTSSTTATPETPSTNSNSKKKKRAAAAAAAAASSGKKKTSSIPEEEPIRRNASKQYLLSTTPPYLTVHLKRFMQTRNGGLQKNSKHIHFPHYLDLTPFTDPTCPKTSKQSHLYVLNGVVEHMGSMGGGHYVAHIYEDQNDNWYYVSDSSYRNQTLGQVLQNQAYVLFYKKVTQPQESTTQTSKMNKVGKEDEEKEIENISVDKDDGGGKSPILEQATTTLTSDQQPSDEKSMTEEEEESSSPPHNNNDSISNNNNNNNNDITSVDEVTEQPGE